MALWGSDGNVSHEDTKTCIRLLGQEVMPAMREIGKELGLNSPFEANAPVSFATAAAAREPVVAGEAAGELRASERPFSPAGFTRRTALVRARQCLAWN